MKELQLLVTLEEANIILEGLGKLPFERVFNVVNKLQEQAKNQLQNLGAKEKKLLNENDKKLSKQA
jgi:hypothetical protein